MDGLRGRGCRLTACNLELLLEKQSSLHGPWDWHCPVTEQE